MKKRIIAILLALSFAAGIFAEGDYYNYYYLSMYNPGRLEGGDSGGNSGGSNGSGGQQQGSGGQQQGGSGNSTAEIERAKGEAEAKRAAEAAAAEAARQAAEKAAQEAAQKAAAEAARKAEEERQAEIARKAEELRQQELAKKAEEERILKEAEEKRLQEEYERKLAEEQARIAEEIRKAEEKKAAEELKKKSEFLGNYIDWFTDTEFTKMLEDFKPLETNEFKKEVLEIVQQKQRAKAAEDFAAETSKKFSAIQDQVDKLKNDVAKLSQKPLLNQKEIKELKKEIEKLKKEEQKEHKKTEKAFKEMEKQYEKLGDLYDKYGVSGDPVNVESGKYIASYTDFKAKDNITNFRVTRKYNHNDYSESFGYDWFCPLDSRIIRCRSEPQKELLDTLDITIESLVIAEDICRDYFNTYNEYPNDFVNNKFCESADDKDYYRAYRSIISGLHEKNLENEKLNVYVLYGRHTNWKDHYALCDSILCLTPEGEEIRFDYDETTKTWLPCGSIYENVYKMQIIGTDGRPIAGNSTDGNIRIFRTDGTKWYYDRYGLLQMFIDCKGNVTQFAHDDGLINSVTLCTGEVLQIVRQNGLLITEIKGKTSGSSKFTYKNGYLSSVTNTDGVTFGYEYDSNGYLNKIKKADGTSIKISYKKDSEGNYRVSSVVNENGDEESFQFDLSKKITKHITFDGREETYKLNASGQTVEYNDGLGHTQKIEVDDNGAITSITKNGIKRTYSYDANGFPEKIVSSDGGTTTTTYSSAGLLTSITDKDGFTNSYDYEKNRKLTAVYYCGNLITSATYNQNGSAKSVTERGITYNYEYNKFGYMTKKTWTDAGKTNEEKWTYDDANRVVKHEAANGEVVTLSYGNGTVTETYGNNKSVTTKTDSRNRVIERTEKDLLTGKSFTVKYTYDGCNNVKKVYLNDVLYLEYNYDKAGNVKDYIEWNIPDDSDVIARQGIKTVYEYNKAGYVLSETVESVSSANAKKKIEAVEKGQIQKYSFNYSEGSNGTTVTVTCGGQVVYTDVYDFNGNLTKRTKPDGYTQYWTYSKAGRLTSTSDSNNNTQTFTYKNDGSYIVTVKNSKGVMNTYSYDASENLVSVKDAYNRMLENKYDSNGNLIEEKNVSGVKSYEYDLQGRLVQYTLKDKSGKTVYSEKSVFDDKNRICKEYKGDNLVRTTKYDAWNHSLQVTDENGTTTYAYDVFGNCIKEVQPDGATLFYEYGPHGTVACTRTNDQIISRSSYLSSGLLKSFTKGDKQVYSAEYDGAGRRINSTDLYGNKTSYEYDKNGILKKIGKYDTGSFNINTELTGKKVVFTDDNGNTITKESGMGGRIEKETDSLGNTKTYTYDEGGRVKTVKTSYGYSATYVYDDANNKIEISYDDGEKRIIQMNPLNQVVKIQNNAGTYSFSYDQAGRLATAFDAQNSLGIAYSYDSYGHCTEKKSSSFDFKFSYNNAGLISKAEDIVSGESVTLIYNDLKLPVKKTYSNGMVEKTEYNKLGQITKQSFENRIGVVVSENVIEYDENNKISSITNEKKEKTFYEYDKTGRLIQTLYPYTEDVRAAACAEALECGIDTTNESPNGIAKMGQNCWYEKYEYTKTGSIASVTTPFGKIEYEYDKMNRLVAKHGNNTASGIFYKWDNAGQLVQIQSAMQEVTLEYGSTGRPVKIVQADIAAGIKKEYLYEYDALGRRTAEWVNGVKTIFLYDGLSSEVIVKSEVQRNGVARIKTSGSAGVGAEAYDFRWFDEDDKTIAQARPFSVLYIQGVPSLAIYTDGTEQSMRASNFIMTDRMNHVVGTTNKYSNSSALFGKNTWLETVSVQTDGATSTQISGESLATISVPGFTDMGLRDYVPAMKSFTTQDPAQDGGNWYAYCSCDPVNFVDVNGLAKVSMTEAERTRYIQALAKIAQFDKDLYLQLGKDQGILTEFDCADVVSMVERIADELAGYDTQSPMQQKFNEKMNANNVEGAKNAVQSENYFNKDFEKNVTQTGNVNDMVDPSILTEGSVLVWKNNNPEEKWIGHVMIVLAVDYDADGNVCGFTYLEGHTGGSKTEVGYMKSKGWRNKIGDNFGIKDWKGEFLGIFELEPANAETCSQN